MQNTGSASATSNGICTAYNASGKLISLFIATPYDISYIYACKPCLIYYLHAPIHAQQ